MNIYISCALTHVPRKIFEGYSSYIHDLANKLKEIGHSVKYALEDSDPQLSEKPEGDKSRLCYLWDRKMVETSDLVIAESSFPSTGLGIEMQLAEAKGIPVIICYKNYGTNKAKPISYETQNHKKHSLQIGEGYVSLMALGLPNLFRVLEYDNPAFGIQAIAEAVEMLVTDDLKKSKSLK